MILFFLNLFFFFPFHFCHLSPPKTGDNPKFYKCRWCLGRFICGLRTYYNLYAHRDGAKGQSACPRRLQAIAAGIHLPLTWAQEQVQTAAALNELHGQPTLDAFLSQATFSVDLCNTVLVMWILKHALPFNGFYDVPLRAAFKLANLRAELRTPTWAAGVAKELYLSLSSAAIALVYVSLVLSSIIDISSLF